ncbi:PAQR family membrane homeostasis protein TrhA [Bacillus smithii]|uniref:PAQR family membrane homeostasis protein TrhA n=1 Tax=Bacillus smithii TaxID=1479 RepID=UPI0030C938E9
MANTHSYSKNEEIANSITHGIGALFSIAALVMLIVYSSSHGGALHIVCFTLFGATMLLLYLSSTIVHSLPPGKAKRLFEIFDHSSIYFFIAGTYTPFALLAIKGWLGWTLFGIVWGIAVGGTIFKCFFVNKYLYTSTLLYVAMGWLVVVAWGPLTETVAPNGILLLVIGGIFYTVGTVFYVWRGFHYHHAVWHLFVLGGSFAHFFAVLFYLLP